MAETVRIVAYAAVNSDGEWRVRGSSVDGQWEEAGEAQERLEAEDAVSGGGWDEWPKPVKTYRVVIEVPVPVRPAPEAVAAAVEEVAPA